MYVYLQQLMTKNCIETVVEDIAVERYIHMCTTYRYIYVHVHIMGDIKSVIQCGFNEFSPCPEMLSSREYIDGLWGSRLFINTPSTIV